MQRGGEVRRFAFHQNGRRELAGRRRCGSSRLLVRRGGAVARLPVRRLVRGAAVRLSVRSGRIAGRRVRTVIRRIRIGATARRYAVVRLDLRLVRRNGGVQLMLAEHVMVSDQRCVVVLQAGRVLMVVARICDVLHRRLKAVMVQVRVVHLLVLSVRLILLAGGGGHLMKMMMHLLIVIV